LRSATRDGSFQSPEGDSRRFNWTSTVRYPETAEVFQSPEGDSRRFNAFPGSEEEIRRALEVSISRRRFSSFQPILRTPDRLRHEQSFNLPKEILVVSTVAPSKAIQLARLLFQSPEGDSRRFNGYNPLQQPKSVEEVFQSPEGDSRRFNECWSVWGA